jgi:transposase-like protein
MAKAQTFAEKAAKLARKEATDINCPHCNKPTKVVSAKSVNSVKTEKGSWKFLEKNIKLCGNCYHEL